MFRIGVVLVVTILSNTGVLGTFWLEQKPSNCPSGDNGKHVCSSLLSNNFTCVTFDCCSNFESNVSNGVDGAKFDGSLFFQNNPEDFTHCPVCYAKTACTLYQCFHGCCPGYQPDVNGVCMAADADQYCQNGGTQYKELDMIACRCQPGFKGSTCDIPVCNCTNGGMCTVQNGRPACSCPAHFTGLQCETPICKVPCLNGGQCVRNGNYEMCACSPYFVGKQCEIPFSQPDTCPPMSSDRLYCENKCTQNADCGADGLCCREGCSTVCRQTMETSCMHEDMMFVVGQSYNQDPCTTCKCMPGGEMPCMAKSCAQPQCPGDTTPVRKPGQCCYTCPDNLNQTETNCKLRDMVFKVGQSFIQSSDPCMTCTCMPGGEMPWRCMTESCAPPQCPGDTTPVRKPGQCCYTCPDNLNQTETNCKLRDMMFVVGQSFVQSSDPCMTCTCMPGGEMPCMAKSCAPPQCPGDTTPVRNPGQCCYTCPDNLNQTETNCMRGDMMFVVGQSYNPDPCMTCKCMPGGEMPCMAESCAPPQCPGDTTPVRKPGQCCYTCPEIEVPESAPLSIMCPRDLVDVYVPDTGSEVRLCQKTANVYARDSIGNDLQVTFMPPVARHCACKDIRKMRVKALAHDGLGNEAFCEFDIVVRDKTPPVFTTCPDNIYIFAEEKPCWTKPVPTDNVGIAKYSEIDKIPREVGVHKMSYVATDYDGNFGFCVFLISISQHGTPVADLPQGLKDRSMDDTRMGVFVGIPVGGVVLVVGVVALIVYILRRKRSAPQTADISVVSKPSFDDRMYAIPGRGVVRLPSYKAGTHPPPQYVSTVSLNAPYPSNDPPPSYSNSGYMSVGEMKKPEENVYDSIAGEKSIV